MNSKGVLLCVLWQSLSFMAAGAAPELHWLRKYGGWTGEFTPYSCRDGITDSKGALIMIGNTSTSNLKQTFVLKYDRSGTALWEKKSQSEATDSIESVVTDAADNVILTGGPTQKYNAEGTLLWKTPSPGKTVDVAVDSAGDVYVCGSASGAAGLDFLVAKYSAAGVELWTRKYDGTAHSDDAALALVALPGGGVAVTGYSTETIGARNYITVKYDVAGTPQWVKFYDSPSGGDDQAVGLVATPQGEFVVAGTSAGKVATIRYSGTGAQLWVNRYEHVPKNSNNEIIDLPHFEICTGIAINSDGITGVVLNSRYTILEPGNFRGRPILDSVMLQLDGSGTAIPLVLRKVDVSQIVEAAHRIAGGPDGFVVAYSATALAAPYDHKIYKITRQGNLDWTLSDIEIPQLSRYRPTFLTLDGEGSIFAGGTFYDPPPSLVPYPAQYALKVGFPQVVVGPATTTGSATNLTWQTVSLSGTVNPNGRTTSWYFEYGETTAYGSRTPDQAAGAGTGVIPAVVHGVPVVQGKTYHFRIVATSSAGTSMGKAEVFFVPHSPYELWRVQRFDSMQTNASSPGGDPDRDGLKNLLEYAFGSDPLDPSSPPQLQPYRFTDSASGFTYLAVDYPVNPLLDDLTWLPEASTDLINWTTGSMEVTQLPNNRRRAVARGFQPYLRLRVSLK